MLDDETIPHIIFFPPGFSRILKTAIKTLRELYSKDQKTLFCWRMYPIKDLDFSAVAIKQSFPSVLRRVISFIYGFCQKYAHLKDSEDYLPRYERVSNTKISSKLILQKTVLGKSLSGIIKSTQISSSVKLQFNDNIPSLSPKNTEELLISLEGKVEEIMLTINLIFESIKTSDKFSVRALLPNDFFEYINRDGK
jgi:hypothetical protein